MDVTDVRVRMVNNEGKMKAIVSIVFYDRFVVHDVRIIEGSRGLFLAMPSKRTPAGEFKDIAHPINPETRDMIEKVVLQAYSHECSRIANPGLKGNY